MKIEYCSHMGDDLMVVDCARVSFDKKSQWEFPTGDYDGGPYHKKSLKTSDQKLINYLAKHEHWSPFSHPQLSVRVTAPIFVARQLWKSHIGGQGGDGYQGAAWNEVSRRYVDDPPEFYMPDKWRGRPPGSIKQGSSDEVIEGIPGCRYKGLWFDYADIAQLCGHFYETSLLSGIAPEQARMILPQSMMTSWIWTGSLLFFMRIWKQRSDSHAQYESRLIADQLGELLEKYWPVSFAAWKEANS